MKELSNTQKKVLDYCHNGEYGKAWQYWKLMGKTYGIYLGEVLSSEFISGDVLASHIGLTEGTPQHSDTPWLKFLYNNELIYVPMKTIRYGVSWDAIYQAGAVYGTGDNGTNPTRTPSTQNASVTIDGCNMKVTLLRGANTDPAGGYGFDPDYTHNSEWNNLLYPIHSGVHNNSDNPSNPSVAYNQWASYSDEDLLVHVDFGNGSLSWTQETSNYDNSFHFYRGYNGVTVTYSQLSSFSNSNYGWRPALRRKAS